MLAAEISLPLALAGILLAAALFPQFYVFGQGRLTFLDI
jgi:hypothetical protein